VVTQHGNWEISDYAGVDGNKKIYQLTSINNSAIPIYGDTQMIVTIRTIVKKSWLGKDKIVADPAGGFSVIINGQFYEREPIINYVFNTDPLGSGTARIKFDGGDVQSVKYLLASTGNAGQAFLPSMLIPQFLNAKEVKIEMPVFMAGRLVFTFNPTRLENVLS